LLYHNNFILRQIEKCIIISNRLKQM